MTAQLIVAAVMAVLAVAFLLSLDHHWTPGTAPQPEHDRLTAPLPEKRSWRQVTGGDDIVPKCTGKFSGELDLSQLYPPALLCGEELNLLCGGQPPLLSGVWEDMLTRYPDPHDTAAELEVLAGCIQCEMNLGWAGTHTSLTDLHDFVETWDGAAA